MAETRPTGARARVWVSQPLFDDIVGRLAEYFEVLATDQVTKWSPQQVAAALGQVDGALVTLNERNTRYTMLTRLAMHDSLTVTDALIAMAKRLPETLLKTITWDQGVEMADHQRFEIATGVQVFFCDPHAPWQRPTNENSNGLIRDFYPKSTNFNHVTDEDIAHTEDLLNTRPRKVLQWATPAEKLAELLDVAPIT